MGLVAVMQRGLEEVWSEVDEEEEEGDEVRDKEKEYRTWVWPSKTILLTKPVSPTQTETR